jgi:hypothetical protein
MYGITSIKNDDDGLEVVALQDVHLKTSKIHA